MLGSPLMYLCIVLGAAISVQYGVLEVLEARSVDAAFRRGEETGAARVAAAVAKSAETVEAVREAETETLAVPNDRARIAELCARSPACRDRGKP